MCAESVRKVCGKCAECLRNVCGIGVRNVCGMCAECVRKVCGKCAESVRNVCGKCAECVRKRCAESGRKVCGKCAECVRNVCGKCAEYGLSASFSSLLPLQHVRKVCVLVSLLAWLEACADNNGNMRNSPCAHIYCCTNSTSKITERSQISQVAASIFP